MKKVNIVIADDHPLFLKGMVDLISSNKIAQNIYAVKDGFELVSEVAKTQPDLVITDIKMPKMDGIEASRKILATNPDMRILVISMYDDEEMVTKMLQVGVHGYLLKNASPEEIKRAIFKVLKDDLYYHTRIMEVIRNSMVKKPSQRITRIDLNPREKNVLRLICQEFTSQEIADKLQISKKTVDKTRGDLLDKIGVRNSVGLAKYALRNQHIIESQ